MFRIRIVDRQMRFTLWPPRSQHVFLYQFPKSMDITTIYNNASQKWDPKSNAFSPRPSAIPMAVFRHIDFT